MNYPSHPILALSIHERHQIHLLVVEPNPADREVIRQAIADAAFASVHFSASHVEAAAAFSERRFTHVLFSAEKTNMPIDAFLTQILEYSAQTIAIPTSHNPKVDDVFTLLKIGARGFLVKPFTAETIDAIIVQATKGEPFSEAVLNANDRNEAFAAMLAASLDKYATTTRQSHKFESAVVSLPKAASNMRSSMVLAKNFAKDGEEALLSKIVDFFTTLSDGPASRLGRTRQRLKKERENR